MNGLHMTLAWCVTSTTDSLEGQISVTPGRNVYSNIFLAGGKPQVYLWGLDSKDGWRMATLRVGRLDQGELKVHENWTNNRRLGSSFNQVVTNVCVI